MLLAIVILPLLGFLTSSLSSFKIGYGSCYITTLSVFASFLLSVKLFYQVCVNGYVYKLVLGPWISVELAEISWSFCFDSLTAIMLIVVTLISLFVHIYSIEYMSADPHLPRFMSYLSFFTFFMLILITANNFLQMFIGWEGVGLCSFLLINFWYTRIQANKAAIKAMLLNRVGDFFLLLALLLIYYVFKSLNYDVVFGEVAYAASYNISIGDSIQIPCIDLICLCLFLGAVGKSAQLGLHTWLPDAMEGPTPVSALIHAATMVTAGVFLVSRCSFLFEFSPNILNLVVIIGAVTAFFAATIGLFQNDIKRVIAYSTCSQLGYMMFACGLSSYEVGVFHLSNHAFFKALLFLGAGSVIHAISDEQDIRNMGGFKRILPFSYSLFLIGSLALIGFPFLSGFYSKDVILEVAFAKYTSVSFFAYILGVLGAFCTAFYSSRLLSLVFLSNTNTFKKTLINAHEGGWALFIPLVILTVLSVSSGFVTSDLFIGFGTDFWKNALFVLPQNYLLTDIEFLDLLYKLVPLYMTIAGVLSAFVLYFWGLRFFYYLKNKQFFNYVYTFLIKKWYIDRIYNSIIGQQVLHYSYHFAYKNLDRGLLEAFGPTSSRSFLIYFNNLLKYLQSGNLYHYLFFMLFSTFIILVIVLFTPYFVFSLENIFVLLVLVFFFIEDKIDDFLNK